MTPGKPAGETPSGTGRWFATTHWSVVLAAGDPSSPDAFAALERLCRTYWYPLYAFIRYQGHSVEEARDLTQGFFERFLAKHYLKGVVGEKGRFRSFLLLALQRFLADQFDQATAAKRGGGVTFVPLDAGPAESRYSQAAAAAPTPEALFDRAWAEALLQNGVEELRREFAAAGQGALFAELKPYLSRPPERAAYSAVAQRLGLSSDAVAMAVLRLRRRYREKVRAEVAHTVASPAEIAEEMHYLVELLAK
jgi:RNA polymerase sigma-70 factor (ECF subfamily)